MRVGLLHGLTNPSQAIMAFVRVMPKMGIYWLFSAIIIGCLCFAASAAPAKAKELPAAATRKIDFAKDVQPLLAKTCYDCHGPEKQKGALRLDQKTAALKGGDTGPVLVAGKSADSLLIQAVAGTKEDLARMPKKRDPLSSEQIGLLRAWIDQGAKWPEDALAANSKDWHKHWAFKPPMRPKPPKVENPRWARNPIDSFILA